MNDTTQPATQSIGIWWAASLAEGRIVPLPTARPAPEQPGTLAQQLTTVDIYLDDPTRRQDPAGAWDMARRLAIPHAQRGSR